MSRPKEERMALDERAIKHKLATGRALGAIVQGSELARQPHRLVKHASLDVKTASGHVNARALSKSKRDPVKVQGAVQAERLIENPDLHSYLTHREDRPSDLHER